MCKFAARHSVTAAYSIDWTLVHFNLLVWFTGRRGAGAEAESPGQLLSACLASVALLSDADFTKVDLHNVCPLGDG